MGKIAVCDDERIELDQIADMIQSYYASDCEMKKYEDAESLLADSRKQVFDVLFLDIDMPGMDGMQLAGRIREDNEYVKIIFVTNKEDCVFKGYKYDAFRFVRKSALNEELTEALDDLSRYFEAKKEYVVFKAPNDEITRYIDRIQYLEVRDHELTIKYDDNVERILGTMRQYDKMLSSKGFIRIHQSFLVNYRYIYSVNKTDVKLLDGTLLPLSRNRISETKTKLQVFTRSMGI